MQYGKKLLDLTTKLLLHVTHCHTWCHHMGEWSRGHLIPPIVLPTIKRKLSTKEACVHKKSFEMEESSSFSLRWKTFSPSSSSKLKTRVNWKCFYYIHFSMDFLLQLQRSSISQNSFSYGPFWKAPIPAQKSHTAKNSLLSNFLTCTTKYNYNGLDLAKSRVWVQCTLLPKRSNVTAVGWKSIHLLHRIATLHAWLERIIYGKRKIWD